MINKKGSFGHSVFYIILSLVLIYFLIRFGIFDGIIDMVKGWFAK